MRKVGIWLISIITIVMVISTASALPEILGVFNKRYNTTGTRLDTCGICHIAGEFQNPVNLNSYGMSIKGNLDLEINQAFMVIEPLDSDGDGFTNIDEIRGLAFPGNKSGFPIAIPNSFQTLFSREDNSGNRINSTGTVDNNENNITVVTNPIPQYQKLPFRKFLGLEYLIRFFCSLC